MAEIEKAAPLLNIFIPDLTLFDESLSVEELDVEDNEIPIFNAGKFYWNGEVVDSIDEERRGAYPIFYTFVVNESPRRIVKNGQTRSGAAELEYDFADEAFNPQSRNLQETTTRGRDKHPFEQKVTFPITKGVGGEANINLSYNWERQNTDNITSKVTIEVTDSDKDMGSNILSFFGTSPILSVKNGRVQLSTDRFGCFDMCIIPVNSAIR